MRLEDFLGLAGVPVVIAAVEAFKRVVPECNQRWYPVVAFVASAIINIPVGWRLGTDPILVGLLTLVVSFAASGLFGQVKAARGQ